MTAAAPAGRFVAAITDQRLVAEAEAVLADDTTDPATAEFASRALEACRRVGERVARERTAVVSQLAEAGIAVESPSTTIVPKQHHTIELRMADAETAARAAAVMVSDGFEPWERWTGGADRSFRHHASMRTVARSTDVTVVVQLRWADRRRRSVVERLFVPSPADWDVARLPPKLWRGYSAIRPVRLLAERIGLRTRFESGLGPFLTTPDELIDDLLDVAGVSARDVVVDLGCGDGRLVVRAASTRGCRARGVERDQGLVIRARANVVAAGVDDLVAIVDGDARTADLHDVTVALVFLPIDVAADVLPELLDRLPAGARLIVHEQHRLPDDLVRPPDTSTALIGEASLTVAHRWDVPTG